MRMSTSAGSSATVASSVFSALYAGMTTAIRLPLSMEDAGRYLNKCSRTKRVTVEAPLSVERSFDSDNCRKQLFLSLTQRASRVSWQKLQFNKFVLKIRCQAGSRLGR